MKYLNKKFSVAGIDIFPKKRKRCNNCLYEKTEKCNNCINYNNFKNKYEN